MKPQPWTTTKLDDFENCPRQFYEKHVAKSLPQEPPGPELVYGRTVHETFEKRLAYKAPLTPDLAVHEPYMAELAALPGTLEAERKIALNTQLKSCGYSDKDVWFRSAMDVVVRHEDKSRIVDHKTGKHHSKFRQLKAFALYEFLTHPEVREVRAEYYWTQIRGVSGETYQRTQLPELWAEFTPSLNRFADAFHNDTWPPKQSGLCNGWCPVTGCEYWRPKRERR